MRRLSFSGHLRAIWSIGTFLAVVVGGGAAGLADEVPGDVVAGRELAVKECSECHSISVEQRAMRLDQAPGFDEIADKTQTTAISLRAFLQSSHPTMPNFVLNESERDNVIAYILSLRQRSH